ncbi:hypothetical protein DPEC_G00057780 [Dallia pectoralis]|uniref:Uncharacterized protein n=1 Tax=Dallia pectoralis TaxID=75939 RepID=A0ACC2H5Z6_DALPE|nr:hypothetical protein DPEC_G00057780 [Dallia pectoralis]
MIRLWGFLWSLMWGPHLPLVMPSDLEGKDDEQQEFEQGVQEKEELADRTTYDSAGVSPPATVVGTKIAELSVTESEGTSQTTHLPLGSAEGVAETATMVTAAATDTALTKPSSLHTLQLQTTTPPPTNTSEDSSEEEQEEAFTHNAAVHATQGER